jgi:heat shock protein HspQ
MERHDFECSNLGNYELIYSQKNKKYAKYIKDADFLSEQFATGNKYKKKMDELAEAIKKDKKGHRHRELLT